MDLFSQEYEQNKNQPLAYRMRPRTLDEYAGQDHIVGKGRLLRRSIQADQLSSVIFYGPPGTGKTTLARVIANTTKSHFTTLNAVLTGVKQLREEITLAKERLDYYQKRTILFVDEVHRWNKSQQDALLPWVENGTIILIGATTENPYFEVNSALVSRSRIFQLLPLGRKELMQIAQMTLKDKTRGYGSYSVSFEEGALEHLVDIANGDARSLLNALELAVETTPDLFPPPSGTEIFISMEAAEESIQKKVVLYDKEGDYHFDVISAFIKSVRGSDPDAVLYWLARMVQAGEDPRFIFRRMLISASEDIGMADPQALTVVESAAAAFDRVGMPEGRFHLTQAALYLASAPKSNSSLGFFDALASIEQEQHQEVPPHLKDPNRDKEGFGHGEGYLYPHAYRDHWVAQQYLPAGLQGKIFYRPSNQGYESEIKNTVIKNRESQLEAVQTDAIPEALSFSPENSKKDTWLRRLSNERGPIYSSIREEVFASLHLQRHHRVLDANAGSGLLIWEGCRLVPEGGVYGLLSQKTDKLMMEHYSKQLDQLERPQLFQSDLEKFSAERENDLKFEAIVGRDVLTRAADKKKILSLLFELLAAGGEISLAETVPRKSTRLSQLAKQFLPEAHSNNQLSRSFKTQKAPELNQFSSIEELISFLEEGEQKIFNDPENSLVNWDSNDILTAAEAAGFSNAEKRVKIYTEHRYIGHELISNWMEKTYLPKSSSGRQKDEACRTGVKHDVVNLLSDKSYSWSFQILFLNGSR